MRPSTTGLTARRPSPAMNKYLRAAIDAALCDVEQLGPDALQALPPSTIDKWAILKIEFEKDCRKCRKSRRTTATASLSQPPTA